MSTLAANRTTPTGPAATTVPLAKIGGLIALAVAAAALLALIPDQRPGTAAEVTAAGTPISFERNLGQAPPGVGILAHGDGYELELRDSGATAVLGSERFGIHFPGAKAVSPAGLERAEAEVSYLVGAREEWVQGAPSFASASYAGLWPGVDAIFRGTDDRIEYDFVVAPGADPGSISTRFAGADSVRLEPNGSLTVSQGAERLRIAAPVSFQRSADGSREPVASEFVLDGNSAGIAVADYDPSRELVIDPVLEASTYLGGGTGLDGVDPDDLATAVAVGPDGSAFVAGITRSADFPLAGAADTTCESGGGRCYEAFVSKYSADGETLLYSTYLGGDAAETINDIEIAPDGSAYVGGFTSSSDFPSAQNAKPPVNSAGFIGKLSPDGDTVDWTRYIGADGDGAGAGGEYTVYGIALDSSGNLLFAGNAEKGTVEEVPLLNPVQPVHAGGRYDAYIGRYSADGSSLQYGTYLGGSGDDTAFDIAVGDDDSAYVVGETGSTDFNTVSPRQGSSGGGSDVFVAKLGASGTPLLYSTYHGGSGDDSDFGLEPRIAVDPQGAAYVTGTTRSPDFPTTAGTIRPAAPLVSSVDLDAFVSKFAPGGGSLAYSTYLGTSDDPAPPYEPRNDLGKDIAVDDSGHAYVTGSTASAGFPTVNPFDTTSGNGTGQAFISKLNPTATGFDYSSPLGGTMNEVGASVALSCESGVWMAGETLSTDFDTVSAVQSANAGALDAFAAKVADSSVDCGGGPVKPPVDEEVTDFDVTAKKKQKQKGKRLKVKVSAGAQEQIRATASGKVKTRKPNGSYKLESQTKTIAGGSRKILKLKPKSKRDARKISKAIRKYKKAPRKKKRKLAVKAPIKVVAVDGAGNREVEKRVVTLK